MRCNSEKIYFILSVSLGLAWKKSINSLMGVQSKQIFEFDSYELDKTFADFDNFVLIKIKSIPSKVI